MGRNRVAIIGGVVTLVGLTVALILGLAVTHNLDGNSTPLVTAILGLVVTTIPAFLALNSAEHAKDAANNAHAEARQVRQDIRDGVLKRKVAQAIMEVEDSRTNDELTKSVEETVSPEFVSPYEQEGNSNG